jgi:hypothetical protein
MRDCEADFQATLLQQTNATLPSSTALIEQAGEGGTLQARKLPPAPCPHLPLADFGFLEF